MRATILACVALLATAGVATADVDVTGSWKVHQLVCFGGPCDPDGPPGIVQQCDWNVAQAGSTLTVSGQCQGFDVFGPATGTIDVSTGAFSLVPGPLPPFCANVVTSGTAASDGSTFTFVQDCFNPGGGIFNHIEGTADHCGDGDLDAGEQCDDGGFDASDCCSATCQFTENPCDDGDANGCTLGFCSAGTCLQANASDETPCTSDGNDCTADFCDGSGTCAHTGIPQLEGRRCDDQNACTERDRCGAGTCAGAPVAAGSPCNADADVCTVDSCDAAGACVPGGCSPCCDAGNGCTAAVDATCTRPTKAKASLKLAGGPRPSLAWSWTPGPATSFPDPAANDYTLCIYEAVGSQVTRLAHQHTAPAGARWVPKPGGFAYRDKSGVPSGLQSVKLASKGDRSLVQVRGKSTTLFNGGRVLNPVNVSQTFPVPLAPAIVAQLRSGTACWTSTFEQPTKNDFRKLIAKRGSPSGAFVD